jgi:outer membrane protein
MSRSYFMLRAGRLLFWLLIVVFAKLQAQNLLTVDDVIQITLQNNYGLHIARDNLQMAVNNVQPGNAGFLPNLDLSVSYSQSRTNSEQSYTDPNRPALKRNNAGSTSQGAGAVLSWTVFDGFKMFASYARYRSLEKIERYKLRKEIETTIADVILTYYDVVQKKLIMQVDREAVSISEQRLQIVQQGYDLGVSSNLEVLQAKVDLNSDRSAFLAQEAIVSDAQSKLMKIMAQPEQNLFTVIDTISVEPLLAVDSLQQMLLAQNADLLVARQDVAMARFELGEIRSEIYPKVSLNSGYSYNRSESEAGFIKMNQSFGYTYGAQLSLNLFNGFNTQRRELNSRLSQQNMQLALAEMKMNISHDFDNLVLKYRNSLSRLHLEQENVNVALENVNIALEIYRLGTITALQLREVQRNYVAAKSRLISTAYEVKQYEVNLRQISGQLLRE